MDHQGQARSERYLDLSREGPALGLGGGRVPVEVESGLPDRHHPVVSGQFGQRLCVPVPETLGLVRVAPHRGEHLREAFGQLDLSPVAGSVESDREDPGHPRLPGPLDQLGRLPLAAIEVAVGVDHPPVPSPGSTLGKSGSICSTR